MYEYKHGKLTREEFETQFRAYMSEGGYKCEEYYVASEWKYYEKGRSWFAAWLDDKLKDHIGETNR